MFDQNSATDPLETLKKVWNNWNKKDQVPIFEFNKIDQKRM